MFVYILYFVVFIPRYVHVHRHSSWHGIARFCCYDGRTTRSGSHTEASRQRRGRSMRYLMEDSYRPDPIACSTGPRAPFRNPHGEVAMAVFRVNRSWANAFRARIPALFSIIPLWPLFSWPPTATASHPSMREVFDPEEWLERLRVVGTACQPALSIYMLHVDLLPLLEFHRGSRIVGTGHAQVVDTAVFNTRLNFRSSRLSYRAVASAPPSENPRTKMMLPRLPNWSMSPPIRDSTVMSGLDSQIRSSQVSGRLGYTYISEA